MPYSDMQTELGFLLNNRNDTDAVDSTRTKRWINQSYAYMCQPGVHAFREMEDIHTLTLVTDTNEYSIATLDSNHVVSLRFVTFVDATSYSNTATRRKVHVRSMRHFEQKTLTTGPTTEYAVDGTTLFINPVPSSNESGKVLRVGYYREPDDLNADADLTELPAYYDRVLMLFAQGFAEHDLMERELSMLTMRAAQALLNNAESESQLEGEETDFRTGVVGVQVMA